MCSLAVAAASGTVVAVQTTVTLSDAEFRTAILTRIPGLACLDIPEFGIPCHVCNAGLTRETYVHHYIARAISSPLWSTTSPRPGKPLGMGGQYATNDFFTEFFAKRGIKVSQVKMDGNCRLFLLENTGPMALPLDTPADVCLEVVQKTLAWRKKGWGGGGF
eukprot:g8251.t1